MCSYLALERLLIKSVGAMCSGTLVKSGLEHLGVYITISYRITVLPNYSLSVCAVCADFPVSG